MALLLVSFPMFAEPAGSSYPIYPVAESTRAVPKAFTRKGAIPKRTGKVQIDLNAFRKNGLARNASMKVDRRMNVSPFSDVLLGIHLRRVERTSIDSIVWSGEIENEESSLVTIAIHDDAISATFATGSAKYVIRTNESGFIDAFELSDEFPEGSEPIAVTSFAKNFVASSFTVESDTPRIADVMVVYSVNVRIALGGPAAAQAFASESIVVTNEAYIASGVLLRVRLAGTLEVSYADNPVSPVVALEHIKQPGDGVLDSVHQMRDSHGADAVAFLVVGDSSSCGVAYRMTVPAPDFAPFAFSVSDVDCAVGNLSFPHELGHNFSLKHDRLNSTSTTGVPYAYGYQDPEGQFRDVMAYAAGCTGAGRPCPRRAFFSNPELFISGRPAGVSSTLSNAADNRRALNEAAATVTSFRASIPAVVFTDDPIVPQTTQVKAVHITELRSAIDSARARVSLTPFGWGLAPTNGNLVSAIHITELRSALMPVLTAVGSSTDFTDATLSAGISIRAAHIQELRDKVR